jgi:hypothetical protein
MARKLAAQASTTSGDVSTSPVRAKAAGKVARPKGKAYGKAYGKAGGKGKLTQGKGKQAINEDLAVPAIS